MVEKVFGKQKVYVINQDLFPEVNQAELKDLDMKINETLVLTLLRVDSGGTYITFKSISFINPARINIRSNTSQYVSGEG